MRRIGVLTSGGDAAGMNAAIRAVVRAGLALGARKNPPTAPHAGGLLCEPLHAYDATGAILLSAVHRRTEYRGVGTGGRAGALVRG